MKIVAVGDLHFGNPHIVSELLYQRLVKYLYPELKDAQLLLLTGDTYDQLTTVNSSANYYVNLFIRDLISIAADTKLKVRILHGTYSHDRDQVNVLASYAANAPVDFKVVNELSCEVLENFNNGYKSLRMLYIPDNLPFKRSEQVIEQIQTLYRCYGWERCEVVLGHGTFSHTLPIGIEHGPDCVYTTEQFRDLVEPSGIVVMGHIHVHSHKEQVYYCGSFDRMSHGEEEPKGFFTFYKEDRPNASWNAQFHVNFSATLCQTITPQGDTPEELVDSLISQIRIAFKSQDAGYVRVIYSEPELRGLYQKICKQYFPHLVFSGKSSKDSDHLSMRLDDLTLEVYQDEAPNKNNLGNLVYEFLNQRGELEEFSQDVIIDAVNQMVATP